MGFSLYGSSTLVLTAWLTLFSFCNGVSRTLLRSAAYALFLVVLAAQQLPLLYIAMSALVVRASFGYMTVARRVGLQLLVPAILPAALRGVLALRSGVAISARLWLLFFLKVCYELLHMMLNLTLWTTAGRLFNVQELKRYSSTLNSVEPAAGLVFGLLTAPLVAQVAAENLLLAIPSLALLCAVVSVTATGDTLLLRLDQAPFYQLMNERNEAARGVMRVLRRHRRVHVRNLHELRTRLSRPCPKSGFSLSRTD